MNGNNIAALILAAIALTQFFGSGTDSEPAPVVPKPAPIVTPVEPIPEPIGTPELEPSELPAKSPELEPKPTELEPSELPKLEPAPVTTKAKPSPLPQAKEGATVRRWTSQELKAEIRRQRPGRYTGPKYGDVQPRTRKWASSHLQLDHGFEAYQLVGLSDDELYHLHDLRHGNMLGAWCQTTGGRKLAIPGDPRPQAVSLVMITGPNCGYCEKWKANELPHIPKSWNYDEIPPKPGQSIPRFILTANGQEHHYTGYTAEVKAAALIRTAGQQSTQSAPGQRAAPQTKTYAPARTYQQPTRRGIFGWRR